MAGGGSSRLQALPTSTVYGLRVHRSGGEGEPPVVLIHGLGNSLDYWTAVVPLLADQRPVVAIDLPGFGRSPAADSSSLDSIERSVTGCLVELGVRSFDLVGHSMGGIVALAMAGRKDSGVGQIVLVDACLQRATEILANPSRALSDVGISANLLAQFVGGLIPLGEHGAGVIGHSGFLRRAALWPFVADPASLDPELVRLALRNNGGLGVLKAARVGSQVDLDGLLERVTVPASLLAGDRDRLMRNSDWCGCIEQLDVRFERRIAECGHWPMIEKPAVLSKLIMESLGAGEVDGST